LGLSILIVLCSGLVSITGIFKLPQAVGIFLNLVILLFAYFYLFDSMFSSFFFGVVRSSTVVFSLAVFLASLFLASSFYKAVRMYL